MSLIDLFMFNEQYTCSLTCELHWLVYGKRCFMNTNEYKLLFSIKVNKVEDLTALKLSPDLLNNVKIGQDQLAGL